MLSRQQRLDQSFLVQRPDGAVAYDRIAGYYRSSLFEVAGEAIAKVNGAVRIVCNSDLDPQDLITAAATKVALHDEQATHQLIDLHRRLQSLSDIKIMFPADALAFMENWYEQ